MLKCIILYMLCVFLAFPVVALKAQAKIPVKKAKITFELHRQYRTFDVTFAEKGDSLSLHWSITQDLKERHGSYTMTQKSRQHASQLCYVQPNHGQHLTLPGSQAFCMASADIINALREESSDTKQVIFNKTYFTLLDRDEKFRGFHLFHLKDYEEGAEMWILDDPKFPLIVKMLNNPVEINWTIE